MRKFRMLAMGICLLTTAVILTAAPVTRTGDKAASIPAAGKVANAKRLSLTASTVHARLTEASQTVSVQERQLAPAFSAPLRAPAQATRLGGGETIATATVITSMPFTDTGTTQGKADDYHESCDGENPSMPDVVYSYTPSRNEIVDLVSCASEYFTRLWVYRTNADTLVACNRLSNLCGQPPRAALYDLPFDSGMTYYIVVDGDNIVPPGYGTYTLACTATPVLVLVDSAYVHPAIADAGNGNMMLAYQALLKFNTDSTDSYVMWVGSVDDGASFPSGAAWQLRASHPSIDFWGNESFFYGTLVPDSTESNGGRTYLIEVDYPGTTANWGLSYWDWSVSGWKNTKMTAIAADDGLQSWQWGILSMVTSTTYGSGVTDGPFISYPTTSAGQATIGWYYLDHCATTDIDIDPITQKSYAVYDFLDDSLQTWMLFIRQDFLRTLPHPTSNGWVFTGDDSAQHIQYPAVAVYDSNLVIVTEYWDETAGNDRDIICWYSSDSSLNTINRSVVAASTDSERYPKVAHVSGRIFLCTFVCGDTLFQSVSYDAGATWKEPQEISPISEDLVVSEYRTADISEAARKLVWEYRMAGTLDSTIFVHFGATTVTPDSDGDGVPDPEDVCPGFNDFADADNDSVPDGCDQCPGFSDHADADLDGVPDSCDNCPLAANPDQLDTNGNGVGNVCDYVCGDANDDGTVNVGDGVFIINYIFKDGQAPAHLPAGDPNCDYTINVGDAVYIINYIFKDGAAPICCE